MSKIIRKILSTHSCNRAALPVRLAVGSVMFAHGSQKLFGWFGGHGFEGTAGFFAQKFGNPGALWAALAGGGEFFGGLALLFGIATRFFGLVTAITMSVAILAVHNSAFFLDKGGMEYALTLFLASVALIISGGGALSVDAALAPKTCRTDSKN